MDNDNPILKTATGKEYPCDFMGTATKYVLYIVIDIDLNDILSIFQNPEETETLQWIGNGGELVREETGFTKFTGFTLMDNGGCHVRIRLEKP